VLLGYCVWISVWMWFTMSDTGGLGIEETRVVTHGKRTAHD
jgi:hypothetical protein